MKTRDLLAIMTAATLLFASCDVKSPFVRRSALEQSQNENAELKNSLQNLQNNFAKQNEDLASILSDLSSISQRTSQIHLNVENPAAKVDTIALINDNIDSIKRRIDKLEVEANKARKINKSLAIATRTIKELRETVSIQEIKIAELTTAIRTKDETISSQNEKINAQTETIAAQEKELRKTVARQVEMIYEAGLALEDIADNGDFKISGRKDKDALKKYRKAIYEKAATYYEAAISQGCREAQETLDNLKTKMAALN